MAGFALLGKEFVDLLFLCFLLHQDAGILGRSRGAKLALDTNRTKNSTPTILIPPLNEKPVLKRRDDSQAKSCGNVSVDGREVGNKSVDGREVGNESVDGREVGNVSVDGREVERDNEDTSNVNKVKRKWLGSPYNLKTMVAGHWVNLRHVVHLSKGGGGGGDKIFDFLKHNSRPISMNFASSTREKKKTKYNLYLVKRLKISLTLSESGRCTSLLQTRKDQDEPKHRGVRSTGISGGSTFDESNESLNDTRGRNKEQNKSDIDNADSKLFSLNNISKVDSLMVSLNNINKVDSLMVSLHNISKVDSLMVSVNNISKVDSLMVSVNNISKVDSLMVSLNNISKADSTITSTLTARTETEMPKSNNTVTDLPNIPVSFWEPANPQTVSMNQTSTVYLSGRGEPSMKDEIVKSCSGKCYRYYGGYSCSCDRLCFFMKTCCGDIDEACPRLRGKAMTLVGSHHIDARKDCDKQSNTIFVDSCPGTEEQVEDDLYNRLGINILVTDERTGMVYKNMQRFRCNTRASPQATPLLWKVVVKGQGRWQRLDSFHSLSSYLVRGLFYFTPPNDDPRYSGYPCNGNQFLVKNYKFSAVMSINPDTESIHFIPVNLEEEWQPMTCDLMDSSMKCHDQECDETDGRAVPERQNICHNKLYINTVVSQPDGGIHDSGLRSLADHLLCAFQSLQIATHAHVKSIDHSFYTFLPRLPKGASIPVKDLLRTKHFRVLIEATVDNFRINVTSIGPLLRQTVANYLQLMGMVDGDTHYKYGVPSPASTSGFDKTNVEQTNVAGEGPSLKVLRKIVKTPYWGSTTDDDSTQVVSTATKPSVNEENFALWNSHQNNQTTDIFSINTTHQIPQRQTHVGYANNTQTLDKFNVFDLGPDKMVPISKLADPSFSQNPGKLPMVPSVMEQPTNERKCKPHTFLTVCSGIFLGLNPSQLGFCGNFQSVTIEVPKTDPNQSPKTAGIPQGNLKRCSMELPLKPCQVLNQNPNTCCFKTELKPGVTGLTLNRLVQGEMGIVSRAQFNESTTQHSSDSATHGKAHRACFLLLSFIIIFHSFQGLIYHYLP